jgi:hypothetical protein
VGADSGDEKGCAANVEAAQASRNVAVAEQPWLHEPDSSGLKRVLRSHAEAQSRERENIVSPLFSLRASA